MQTDDEIVASAMRILMRRLQSAEKIQTLSSTEDMKKYLLLVFGMLPNEEFGCLFLNSQQKVICYETLFKGIVNYCAVYPREVVKKALVHNATGVILVHNHPGGSATASRSDVQTTITLQKTLAGVDVAVRDHVIIHGNLAYSLKENGDF